MLGHLEKTWGHGSAAQGTSLLLVPGDCLVPLRSAAKGLVLVLGVTEQGAYVMHCGQGRTSFGLERWSNIRSSWERGETRKLSTFT